jgi:hypothetical protein
MDEAEDYLFPMLFDDDSQTIDWWAIRSLSHLAQRTEAMHWLAHHNICHWVTYVVMHDFLDVKVIQQLHKRKISPADIRRKIIDFFFCNDKQSQISTIPLAECLHT